MKELIISLILVFVIIFLLCLIPTEDDGCINDYE